MKPYNDKNEGGNWQGAFWSGKQDASRSSGRKRARQSGRREIEEIKQELDDENLEKANKQRGVEKSGISSAS